MSVKLVDDDQLGADTEWIGSYKPLGTLALLVSKTRPIDLRYNWCL
jgi:hypothetical protein